MKNLGKTKFCLGIQIEHLSTGIFIHQSSYTEKLPKKFNMGKVYPLTTPMVVQTLDVQEDPFHPHDEREIILAPENSVSKYNWYINVSCR